MMNNHEAKRFSPPDELLHEVEGGVMKAIDELPSPVAIRAARRRKLVAGAGALAVAVLLIVTSYNPSEVTQSNQDFTENRIVLAGHTSIWLTPVNSLNGE